MNMMEEGDEHHEFMMKKEMKIWVCIFFFQSWGRKMLIFFVRDDFKRKKQFFLLNRSPALTTVVSAPVRTENTYFP